MIKIAVKEIRSRLFFEKKSTLYRSAFRHSSKIMPLQFAV